MNTAHRNPVVALLGNSGAGKTALAHALQEHFGYPLLLESHTERPYQQAFMDARAQWGFHNQVDYLLHRAEQERRWQAESGGQRIALADGGLDLDLIFTRFFHQRGYLSADELAVCERLYAELRAARGFPLLFLHLTAPLQQLADNRIERARPIDIIQDEDLAEIESGIQDWIREHDESIHLIELSSDEGLLTETGLEQADALIRAQAER